MKARPQRQAQLPYEFCNCCLFMMPDGTNSHQRVGYRVKDILVLMDIQLSVLDGYDATRQIKALPDAAIPIIAVSSFAMNGDEEKARAAACDHYVTKPYSPVQLLRIIRGFLGDQL